MKHFMTWLGLALSLLISCYSKADLLDRIRLEDTIRTRIEDVFHLYDSKAKVLLRFDYKSMEGFLPGTNIESKSTSPDRIESADISRLNVEIYSELDTIPNDAKDVVMHVVPFESSKVSVQYKKLLPQISKNIPQALDPQSLAIIAQDSVSSLSRWLGFAVFVSLISALGYAIYSNYVKMREFKLQIGALTHALTESVMGGGGARVAPTENRSQTISVKTNEDKIFEKFPKESLMELFADCYWTKEDRYASWLWKQMASEQKSTLLSGFPFMKEYSLSFLQISPVEKTEHDHPYYLNPSRLRETSQEDLAELVKQSPGIWRRLSPLRQQNLQLTLADKLKAMSALEDINQSVDFPKSAPREIHAAMNWGRLSESDESALFQNPEIIPVPLQSSVSSLVWLAHREAGFIKATLEKYDARSLASAWIGPDEVLKKLEQSLPEKKAQLLQTYKGKIPPSRESDVFQALVKEGISYAS